MRILCLYNNDIAIELFDYVRTCGHETILCSERLRASWCKKQSFDLTISYTYRYILTQDILDALNNNVVNIHNSFLPWNRGADPNIWSVLENTPRGVTLHYIGAQLDHGDIIAQTILPPIVSNAVNIDGCDRIDNRENPTLASTYNELDHAAKELFKTAFSYYPFWGSMRKNSTQAGSYHRSSELAEFKERLDSYDVDINTAREIHASLTEDTLYGVDRKPCGGVFLQLKGSKSCYGIPIWYFPEVCVA